MQVKEQFTSRWGLLVAAIGMAVGTGNIWRFPRVAAQNDGGSFLVPWLVFLVLWSIPLLMVETAMGRHTRRGTVGAFARLIGPKNAWLGCFVGFCSMAILFYYSVVAGWCFKYLSGALSGSLLEMSGEEYWTAFQSSSYEAVLFHFVAMSVAGLIVYRGVIDGIEKASKVLIPLLFVLLLGGAARAVTLPGASAGLDFLFGVELAQLLDYRIWLEGLTQSAWSTGAGYGLLLSYAVYTSSRDDIVMNSMTIGFGNNSASLLAGIMVICSVFALAPADPGAPSAEELLQLGGPGNTALSFFWIPALFQQMPFGHVSLILFFLALVVAAISSMIAMIELGVRIFIDAGMSRPRAVKYVVVGGFLLGLPSALSMDFLVNQDSVWGIGLMVSGFLFAFAVNKFGVRRFREELIEPARNDIPVGRWFDIILKWIIPAEFLVMIVWWLYQAAVSEPDWWDPFVVFSLGTCVFQWVVAFVLFRVFNDRIAEATLRDEAAS
jgi:NSS family neurotransmitter:Na+ symporter